MAVNLSGGNGKLSFEEWRRQRGGNTASASVSSATDGKLSFEEWREQRDKVKNSTASPALPEPAKALDKSGLTYGNSAGLPLRYYPDRLDDGKSLEAERLRTVADRLSDSRLALSDEERKTLDTATMLRQSRRDREADALDASVREKQRQYLSDNAATVQKLRDKAYTTEQEGIKKIFEKFAASDPEYLSKAAAGYEDKSNPIQKQRQRQLANHDDLFEGVADGFAPFASTLQEQVANSKNGKRTQTGIQYMNGVNASDMTPEELRTYSYWYNKSPHAAERYLESISADVNRRTAERETAYVAEDTRKWRDSGIPGTIAAGLSQITLDTYTAPLALASNIGAKISGKAYDPYSALNRGMLNASAMQEGLTGDLPTFGKFLADTGLSTAQYLSRIPLGAAGLVVMASGAAGKTANEVKRNGGSTDQALKLGTIAGIAEYASEKIPFENVAAAFKGGEKKAIAGFLGNAMKSSLGQSLGAVAGSAAEEGLEELITEYVNNIANEAIMGDESEMKKYARELVEGGMDYEEACRTAFKQFYVTNPLVSFAGGALSGAVMTGAGEAWHKRGEIGRALVNPDAENLASRIAGKQTQVNMTAGQTGQTATAAENAQTAPIEQKAQTEQTATEQAAQTEQTATEQVNEPIVNPKDEQFDKDGHFILRTAEQENRIRRAKASNDDIERSGRLAGATDSQIRTAQTLSKVFGRNIIFDSTEANVNGKFANGTIYVNPKGTDNVGTILAHEFTHSLEGTNEYNAVADILKRSITEKGGDWNALKDQVRAEYEVRYENMGQEFTDADCENETLAKVAQSMFSDDAAIENFARQNRNAATRFWHRLTQGAKRLAEDFKARWQYDRDRLNLDARNAQLALRRVEDLRDRFAAALRKTKKDFGEGETSRNSFAQRKIPSYDELVAKPDMNIVDIGNEDTTRSFKEQRVDFMNSEEAKEICKEPVVNRDTGERVFITPASFTHIFSDNARFKQNLARNIRAVLENAVLTHAEKATHGATNTSGVYTLFAAVRTDEGVKPVKIKVKEYINEGRELSKPIAEYFKQNGVENPYSSMYDGRVLELESVEEIRKEAASSSAYAFDEKNSSLRIYPSTASTISIADFLPLVNREFEKYLPKPEENSGKTRYSLADSALARAKQMEADGASPMSIKNATGWWRDDSGNWKKKWNKSSDMFSGEIPRTERSADGGLNEALDSTRKSSAVDSVTAAAKKFFGTTYDWNKTGYLLTDGSQLDFSGKHEGYDSGMRSVDHREIENVYTDGKERLDALNDFLQKGNIRIMPESNGINLATLPTGKQEIALRRYINRVRGEVTIDIDDANGNTVKSLEYDSGTSAVKILDDIHQYFERGAGSESDIAMFHRMGDQYSLADSQYGTKPQNSAEEIMRKKALALLERGKDPEYVYSLTGWFRDDFGNLVVDHGAEIFSYGENDTDNEVKLKRENEELKKQTASILESRKSEELNVEAMHEAYERGKADTREALEKALHTAPNMTPDAKYIRKLSKEVIGDDVSQSKQKKLTRRITELYDRMGEIQSAGQQVWGNEEISKEMDAIATEIQDSRFVTDGDKAAERDTILKEFKTPMFLSPKARGDFAEGYSNLKKQMGKRMTLVGRDKGVPVDVRYMELNEQFGNGWFPAEIINEADQFAQMMNIVKTVSARDYAKRSYYDFSGWEKVYKDEHADIMTKLAEGYANLEQRPKDWSDKIVFNIRKSFQQMEREHAAETEKLVAEMQAEYEKVQADSEKKLSEYQDYMNKRISDAVQGSLKYKEENDKFYHSRVNAAIDQANKRVEYYEAKEKARLDKEAADKAARAQRRHDRGGDISADKISAAVEDGSFHSKMLKLYDTAKDLSEECAKYADVDIESLSEENRAEVKKLFEQLDNINSYINKVHQVQKKVRVDRALAEIAKGDIKAWKDKSTGFGYAINTMVRNIEDISKGDELGKQIIEQYVKPVHKHEAMKQRFMTSMRDRVQALGLNMNVEKGNKLSESAMVQLLGECRSNIEMLENGNGNAVNKSGEPIREGRTLDEWRAIQTTILTENQNMNMEKIEGAITEFHAIYNELFDALNRARVLAGYAPVDYHAGYFPHFNDGRNQDGILAKIMSGLGLSLDNDALPTSINGLTHTFRPGIKYMSNVNKRSVYGVGNMYNGFMLTAGAVEGFDRYIQTAADVIYHTEDIQNLRALSDAIRYSTTDEGRKKQIDTLRADSTLTPQEQDSRIAELFENKQHYRLSNFVVNLEEWTNIIAGKKSILDRQFEQLLGRSMYQNMKKLEQRIAANQVSLNPGSWLTNFVPLTQAGSVLTQKQLLTSLWDSIKNHKQSDGFRERSDFLTNRFGSENLVQTKADKLAKTLGKPMEIIDGFTAESIVRARYAQNIKKGLTESDAMSEADMFAYKLMANRAKGDMPTIFHASNPVLKLFTQYQLEVNNQLAFILKDLPKEAKARDPKWAKELVKMLVKMSIGAWLYNEVYELVVGRRCALDPIDIFNDFAGDLTGYKAPGIADVGDAVIGEKKWSEIAKTDRKDLVTTGSNLAVNVASEMPFIGGVLGGGRIPIQSALPDLGNIKNALTGDKALSRRAEMLGKEILKPAAYILPPFGGGQIKKAVEGTMAFAQGGSYTRDNEGNRKLQYPVENKTVGDALTTLPQAVLFGRTANRYGRDWVDDGFGSLSAKATTAYEALVDDGVDQGDAYESMKEMKTYSSRADKVKYLRGLDGGSDAKRVVFEQMILGSADSIESASDKLDSLDDANISIDYYLDAYEAYLRGEGDARKVDTVNAIQSSGLSSEQKDVLYCCFYREKGLPDTPWHNLGGRKIMANENGLAELPKVSMPTINMPTINMPKLK